MLVCMKVGESGNEPALKNEEGGEALSALAGTYLSFEWM